MKLVPIATLAILMLVHGAAAAQGSSTNDPSTQVAPASQGEPAQQPARTVDPEKAKVIHELLAVTGAANIGQQMMDAMAAVEKQSHPDVDPKIIDRLLAKLDMNEMLESVVAIYDRHFSTEDLKATLAFYQSPVGQRVLRELPPVMKESMAAGQEWGRLKAMELMKELEKEQQGQPVKNG